MSNPNYKWHNVDFDKFESNTDDDTPDFDIGDSPSDYVPRTEEETMREIEYVESKLWGKLEKAGEKISFARDIMALYRYMTDSLVSWHRKAIVVGALVYFITPIDTIPDIAPLIGYLDDLGVLTALLKYLGNELQRYYE